MIGLTTRHAVFSETAWAIFTIFHKGPSVERVLTICSDGSAPLNKMAAMPIYSKNTQLSSFPEARKLWGWILIYSTGDKVYQFCSNDGRRLNFDLLREGQICAPIHLYGKTVEKSFSQWIIKTNGWNLQRVIKVVKLLFSYCQKFGVMCLSLPLGYIDV